MDTENCTNLYIQVCQTFLTCDYNDPTTYEDLFKHLPWLRQSLACCICTNVLVEPMSSSASHCQHFICRKCHGGKMILRPSCSWCKDQSEFEVNKQLEILVDCFKSICNLIYHSPILTHIKEYDDEKRNILNSVSESSITKQPSAKRRKKSRKRLKANEVRKTPNSILNISVSQVLEDGLDIQTASYLES